MKRRLQEQANTSMKKNIDRRRGTSYLHDFLDARQGQLRLRPVNGRMLRVYGLNFTQALVPESIHALVLSIGAVHLNEATRRRHMSAQEVRDVALEPSGHFTFFFLIVININVSHRAGR